MHAGVTEEAAAVICSVHHAVLLVALVVRVEAHEFGMMLWHADGVGAAALLVQVLETRLARTLMKHSALALCYQTECKLGREPHCCAQTAVYVVAGPHDPAGHAAAAAVGVGCRAGPHGTAAAAGSGSGGADAD